MRLPIDSRPTRSSASGTAVLMNARERPMTLSANEMFCDTVLVGSSRKSWKTVPMLRRK